MTKNLPALVYGTLRPGEHNYKTFLEGMTIKESTVIVNGFRMYSGGGFPYITPAGENDNIVAELVYIDPEAYDYVMHRLDFLEGYRGEDRHNHYDRRIATVMVDGEAIDAWIYVAGAYVRDDLTKLPEVEHGDWVKFNATDNDWARYLHA